MILKKAAAGVTMNDVSFIQRLGNGKELKQHVRPLKVIFKDKDAKFNLMNKRKEIANDTQLKHLFHNRIFVDCDSSFLVQKEEFRLRKRLKELKTENPTASAFIRSGVLYVDGSAADKVDISKQLF